MSREVRKGTPKGRWLATFLEPGDRQIFGLLAPTLQKAIGWNELQYTNGKVDPRTQGPRRSHGGRAEGRSGCFPRWRQNQNDNEALKQTRSTCLARLERRCAGELSDEASGALGAGGG